MRDSGRAALVPMVQSTDFGYTEREAGFLCRAALHSGYFLRRQFLAYAGGNYGKLDSRLSERVLENGHAKATGLRYRQVLYHLCSKPLYAALGETDNRNRRDHFVFTIKARLMALDFVLQHPSDTFLATEDEKVRFFRDQLNVAADHLPARRYSAKAGTVSQHAFSWTSFRSPSQTPRRKWFGSVISTKAT